MANLLEKASIILTPTAYDDGKVLAIKPSEAPYGDFDFTRNSSATRVNAQGLVEDVQILSSNLVQNGDFSQIGSEEVTNGNFSQIGSEEITNGSFSQIGSELILNGDFATDSNWIIINNVGSSTNISGGSLNIVTDGAFSQAAQDNTLTSGKSYVLTYTITSNAVVGSLSIVRGSTSSVIPSTVGTHSFYFESDGAGFAFKRGGGALNISIDNVSVKEVGQDWELNGLATMGDDVASFVDNGTNTNSSVIQDNVVLQNTTYKLTFDIVRYTSGALQVSLGNSSYINNNLAQGVGSYSLYVTTGSGSRIEIKRNGGVPNFDFDITNISVKEVGQDWDEKGGEIVSVDSSGLVFDNSTGNNSGGVFQNLGLSDTKIYRMTATMQLLTGLSNGTFTVFSSTATGTGQSPVYSNSVLVVGGAAVTETFEFTPASGDVSIQLACDRGNATYKVSNISVKEVGQNWSITNQAGATSNIILGALNIVTDGAFTNAEQTSVLTSGNNYRLTYTVISNAVVGNLQATIGDASVSILVPSIVGTHTVEFTSAGNAAFAFKRGGGSLNTSITNISILEITDDTNLPRINYSGFTYQDSLGSEEIVNGDFSNGSTDWSLETGWSIGGGVAIASGSTVYSLKQVIGGGILPNTTYEITYNIVTSTTDGAILISLGTSSGGVSSGNSPSVGKKTIQITTGASTNNSLYIKSTVGTARWNGSIDNVSVKEYLGQEVVPDSGCGAWLFEPESTNRMIYSEDFSQWTLAGTLVLESGYLAPDGTNNATKVTSSDLTGFLYEGGFLSSTTKSIYARSVSGSGTVKLLSKNDNTNNTFTLTEQWQRFDVNNTTSASSIMYAVDFRNDATLNEIIIWGANATNDQDYPTSYIPTEGTIKTRNQDLCTNGGDVSLINSTEGVLYAQIAALSDDGITRTISLSDGGNTNRIHMFYNSTPNAINVNYRVSNTTVASITKVLTDITDMQKIAFKWKSGDFSLFIDGIEVGTNSNTTMMPLNTLNKLSFAQGIGTAPFFGNTKALGVWKEALTDAELRSLTYPTPTAATFDLDFNTIATDFTFTRNSEATFVNAQGLIQSTNELGAEEIINGDFSNGSANWTLGTGWSISGGIAALDGTQVGSSGLGSSTMSVTSGKTYKIVVNVISKSSGFRLYDNNGVVAYGLNVGENVFYRTVTSSTYQVTPLGLSGATGSIDNVSVKEYITETNTPRLDYSTGAEAFLLEPQSTNLITYSEDFSVTPFSSNTILYTSNTTETLSPSGDNTSDKFEVTASNSDAHRRFTRNISLQSFTLSVYVKGESGQKFQLFLARDSYAEILDIDTTLSGEWERIVLSGAFSTISSSVVIGCEFGFGSSDSVAGQIYYLWGAQLEQQSYATSYIPTDGATATRNQEICKNATPEINSEEGVLYAEIAALANDGTSRLIGLSDGTSTKRINIYYDTSSNSIYGLLLNSSVQGITSFTLSDSTNFAKIAFKYKENDFALWVNGTEVDTDSSGTTFTSDTLNKLSFDRADGVAPFFGNTKGLKYYPKALSDVELQDLTTI